MKTKFDLTQFEDNSDRTTCTVSVFKFHCVCFLFLIFFCFSAPTDVCFCLSVCPCVFLSTTDAYGKGALAPHEKICMQTSWVHRIFYSLVFNHFYFIFIQFFVSVLLQIMVNIKFNKNIRCTYVCGKNVKY